MSSPLRRPLARLGVLTVATTAALVGLAGVAAAHVTVSSSDAAAEGYGKVTFRVPNESATASTVSLEIQLPTDTPLASVAVEPVPGWTAATTTETLDPPLTDDDGNTVTEAIATVSFTAAAGGGIAPGQFQEFALSAGPFPDADSITFNVVQTYSDGSETAWIEPTVAGQEEPEHPAPVLTLAAAGEDHHGGTDTETSTEASTETATDEDHDGSGLAVTALVVGALGLVAGLAGLLLGLRASRRTVGS